MGSAGIQFGIVDKYVHDRGFGFLSSVFPTGADREIFFHIKSIRRARPDIATKLENDAVSKVYHNIGFWFSIEETDRGKKAIPLPPAKYRNLQVHADSWVEQLQRIWIASPLTPPAWMEEIAHDLLGTLQTTELKRKVEEERARRQAEREARRAEQEAEQKAEREAWLTRMAEQEAQWKAENAKFLAKEREKEAEFEAMVEEFRPLGFTRSRQISDYIKRNKLGLKYKKLSGDLEMNEGGDKWIFNGAIDPEYYARLCGELRLQDQGSTAVPGRFTPEEDRMNRRGR